MLFPNSNGRRTSVCERDVSRGIVYFACGRVEGWSQTRSGARCRGPVQQGSPNEQLYGELPLTLLLLSVTGPALYSLSMPPAVPLSGLELLPLTLLLLSVSVALEPS